MPCPVWYGMRVDACQAASCSPPTSVMPENEGSGLGLIACLGVVRSRAGKDHLLHQRVGTASSSAFSLLFYHLRAPCWSVHHPIRGASLVSDGRKSDSRRDGGCREGQIWGWKLGRFCAGRAHTKKVAANHEVSLLTDVSVRNRWNCHLTFGGQCENISEIRYCIKGVLLRNRVWFLSEYILVSNLKVLSDSAIGYILLQVIVFVCLVTILNTQLRLLELSPLVN